MKRRSEKGGLYARLFSFGICYGLLYGIGNPVAAEDSFESVAGVDYDRHLWMRTEPCGDAALVTSVPGLERERPGCTESVVVPDPSFSRALYVAWEQEYRNLLSKKTTDTADESTRFRHTDLNSHLELRYRPLSWVTFRSNLEYTRSERSLQDNSVGQNFGGTQWISRNALELFARSWFVPVFAVGIGSEENRELAVGLRGDLSGFSWAAIAGTSEKNVPLVLRLENYSPMSVPLLERQEYQALTAGWRGGLWEFNGTARRRLDRHPDTFDPFYSLVDSGESREVLAGAAYSSAGRASSGKDSGALPHFRISIEAEYLEGARVFRGVRSTETLYQFAYEETRNRNAWARTDLRIERGTWRTGMYVGASSLDWDAVRPAIASGKHFWDRSGVLDSYEGNILNIFTRETWLFNGDFQYRQGATGMWAESTIRGWTIRPGLNVHILDAEAHGHLTKRTSTLIIAYTEEDYQLDFYGITAGFLTPELGLTRRLGRGRLEFFAAQAIPVSIRMRHGVDDGAGASQNLSSKRSYSGGTRANLRFSWEAF
jgi:hypothetical protein